MPSREPRKNHGRALKIENFVSLDFVAGNLSDMTLRQGRVASVGGRAASLDFEPAVFLPRAHKPKTV